jgi:hypothetical protein
LSKLKVISVLPKAGLGNKLFSWASGVVFSDVNNCPHFICGLTKFHPMTIIRGDRSKRLYFGYFKNEKLLYFYPRSNAKNLSQKQANKKVSLSGPALFSEIPHWSDRFHLLRDHRKLIVERFWNTLTKRIKKRIEGHDIPCVSLHIRMGDFRELKEGEDFSKVGAVRTPLNYFIEVVKMIREYANNNVSVTVFSDGSDNDLKSILSLPNTRRAEDDLDIVHLALMSKSSVIVMSAGSTFSFWAGFLSKAILIDHYQHKHSTIRNDKINTEVFEGVFEPNTKPARQLQENLKNLNC